MSEELERIVALHRHPVVRRLPPAAAGVPLHLVGGMIRDAALARETKDVDVVVAGCGRQIAERWARDLPARLVPLGGKEFAAYRLVGQGFEVDLWDREEMSLTDDLARRDVTINALALDLHRPGSGPVDPFGGLADLAARLLRATTPGTFEDDPLRVLRLPRLRVVLEDFEVEAATAALARAAAPGLSRVAAERVREELGRIAEGAEAARGFETMAELALYPGLLLGRPGTCRAGDEAAAAGLVEAARALPAAGGRVEAVCREAGLPTPALDLPAARRCLLAWHLPQGAEDDPAAALERWTERGWLSRAEAKPAARLVGALAAPAEIERDEPELRRLLHRLGPLWPAAAALLDREPLTRSLARLVREDGERIFEPPRLLTGEEVQEILGVEPGPAVGRALAAVRDAQVTGRIATREEAVAWIEARAAEAQSPAGGVSGRGGAPSRPTGYSR